MTAPPSSPTGLIEQCSFLPAWFEEYGRDSKFEIEARIKHIHPDVFSHVMRKLSSFKGWQSTTRHLSMDSIYSSGVRQTASLDPSTGSPTGVSKCIHKKQILRQDVSDNIGNLVRFSVSIEDPTEMPTGSEFVEMWRLKDRITFSHKGEIDYDLTTVRSSSRDIVDAQTSPPEFEIELEWSACRNASGIASTMPSRVMADKFLLKVQDLVLMKREGEMGGAR
jgi:mRNA capping enzyme, beta chain